MKAKSKQCLQKEQHYSCEIVVFHPWMNQFLKESINYSRVHLNDFFERISWGNNSRTHSQWVSFINYQVHYFRRWPFVVVSKIIVDIFKCTHSVPLLWEVHNTTNGITTTQRTGLILLSCANFVLLWLVSILLC